MTSVPPVQPPAAPETDVRLTEAERDYFCGNLRQNLGYRAYVIEDTMIGHVERIVAERVRVVEGERDAALARVDEVVQLNTEKARHVRQLMARLAEVAEVAEERGNEVQAQKDRAESAETEVARLQTLVDQGAAGAVCPDLRTHGERVHRIVAEAESAEAAHRALEAGLEAFVAAHDNENWRGWGIPQALRALLAGGAR